MTNPRILVYVPFHNYEMYIRECLDSVLNQTYTNNIEIIASDNASTDSAPSIITNEYPQVRLIQYSMYNELNNPGTEILLATDCDFFCFLAADDKLVPNFWEKVLPYFENPKVGFVRVGCMQFGNDIPNGSWWRPIPWHTPIEILMENKVFSSSPIRKSAFNSIGGEDLNCFFADWDRWIRIVLNEWKWDTIPEPLYWYRRHEEAWSYRYNYRMDGPAYTYMRNKWMWALRKYNILRSNMASISMIRGENESSNPGWR